MIDELERPTHVRQRFTVRVLKASSSSTTIPVIGERTAMNISEPKIVIGHREHLWILLSEALQLEHMIMCQYLFAQFSLKLAMA
jgi:Putative NADH-flavin reductase